MSNDVRLWARVSPDDIRDIQRALPKWGWRSALMRHVFAYLAQRLREGERPSMEKLEAYSREAVDTFIDNNDLKL
jgi:hypothetical protein